MTKNKKAIRILHLEDSATDAQLMADMIAVENLDCEIVRAQDAGEFNAALLEQFDVILCDYNLPGYDGISALIHAREKHPETPVIIVSGSIGEEEAVKCLQFGATDYLLKDRLERFVPAIRRALVEAEEQRKRRRSEAELRESEERFRQLAEHSSEVFWFSSVRPEKILFVSPAVEKVWGQPAKHFYENAEATWNAIHEDDVARVRDAWKSCLAGNATRFEEEYRVVQPSGAVHWVFDTRTSIRDETGRVVRISGVTTDITERKEVQQQVLRAQRLESLGTLAGGVAHDLNNALAPILMATELLRLQFGQTGASHLDVIEGSARRGAGMVRQLLTFARGSDGERLILQPRKLFAEMEKLIRGTFPKNIHLKTEFPKQLPSVIGDPTQLHQVLLNLCVNARDAMPKGGLLTLKAGAVEIDHVYAAAVPDAKPGRYVVWRVEDTGTGIPSVVLDRIFEPFFTTKGEKGTGLGLSTVIGIVKSHNGFVRVYSATERGTTFAVYLPAAMAEEADTKIVSRTKSDFLGDGETVLVVDDESVILEVFRTVLGTLNLKVLTAANGTEALIHVADHRTEIRAVITDLHMPEMDGLSFVRVLKGVLPAVGIIVASGRIEEAEQNQFKALGVNAFLDKPFTHQKLVQALKAVLPASQHKCGRVST
jgi:two-component system, cell cycle sensor histidine kinase and response regulator CckA